jgi:hypothetical protein
MKNKSTDELIAIVATQYQAAEDCRARARATGMPPSHGHAAAGAHESIELEARRELLARLIDPRELRVITDRVITDRDHRSR